MTPIQRIVMLSVISFGGYSPSFAADFYRWVDADGVLHFDTKQPANIKTTKQTVNPDKNKRPDENRFTGGCKTEKCQRNLEKLLGHQLRDAPKLTPRRQKHPRNPTQPKVVKLSPTTKKEKSQSTLQRFLQRQNQNTMPQAKTHQGVQPKRISQQNKGRQNGLEIPANYTLIAPNKKNQQRVRTQYGTEYSASKKQKSDAVLRRLIREKPGYY